MHEKPRRILHMVGKMDMGGQETFIMNLYRNINRQKIQFDFIVNTKQEGYYDKEIESLGGKIYHITSLSKNPIAHCRELKDILSNDEYDIIHRHTCSSIVAIDLLVAKFAKVNNRIVHSHANKTEKFPLFNYLFRPILNFVSTQRLACSREAACHLFGKKKGKKAEVIVNAIDTEKYKFNPDIRLKLRKEYESEKKLVIGHVGRLEPAKNHKFLIDVFCDYNQKNKDAVLWLIGSGSLEEELKEQVKLKEIEDKVKFLGTKNNIEELLMAMDVFVFPSIYEGLGIALIEAQCSGLECLASSNIQDEAIITDRVKRIDIDDSKKWIEALDKIEINDRQIVYNDEIKKYDINELVKHMYKVWRV